VHSDFFTGIAIRSLVQVHWLTGQWAQALGNRQKLLDWLRISSRTHIGTVWAARMLGTIHNDLGQADLARQVLERDLATALSAAELQTTVPHLAELARANAALGRDADAATLLHELLTWLDSSPQVVFDAILPVLVACHWFATRPDAPDLDGLRACVDWLQRAADRLETEEGRAALAEASGIMLRAGRAPSQAARQFHHAAERWEALGRPYDQARALSSLGETFAESSQASGASAALDQALVLYHTLARQLSDPELARSFLNSPQVRELIAARANLPARTEADPSSSFEGRL
jgi:tetratricopeptide (TPR) repeat protein